MSLMKMLSLFACVALIHAQASDKAGGEPERLELQITQKEPSELGRVRKGEKLRVHCKLNDEGQIWWMKDGRDVSDRPNNYYSVDALLLIESAKIEDEGDYICLAKTENGRSVNTTFHVSVYEHRAMPGVERVVVKVNSSTYLSCPVDENDIETSNLEWKKPSESDQVLTGTTIRNGSYSSMILQFPQVSYEHNGTYECSVKNDSGNYISHGQRFLIVAGPPDVKLSIKPIGAHSVYLNWTIIEHNIPVTKITIECINIEHMNTGKWITYRGKIDIKSSSSNLIWQGLDSNGTYRFRMNVYDSSKESRRPIFSDPLATKTLTEGYEYTPGFEVTEKTNESITFEFEEVPAKFNGYFDYFTMEVTHGVNETTLDTLTSNGTTLTYKFPEPKTVYKVRGAACSTWTHQCGNWSSEQVISNGSAGLYPSGISLAAVIIASVYFSAKHLVA